MSETHSGAGSPGRVIVDLFTTLDGVAQATGRWRSEMNAKETAARCAEALSEVRERLVSHGVEPERLAELVPAHRRFLVARPARMHPLGAVWRLGVLLLSADEDPPVLYATGRVTRAAERGRPNYQSASREERREIAAAAVRGGYAIGTRVNFDATRIPLDPDGIAGLSDDAPVGVFGDELRVRWRADAPLDPAPSLEAYLAERAELLINPPEGS